MKRQKLINFPQTVLPKVHLSPAPSLAPQYSSVHAPVPHHSTVSLQYTAHPGPDPGASYQQHSVPTYQQQTIASHPTFATAYSPFVTAGDPKRHTVRSPVSGKFVQRGLEPKRQVAAPKERKRPGPKAKVAKEAEPKPPDEPEYDPEVIANAHLTMEDDYYKCSVCKMKFKQPGNARRHIITVHRNEKNHECLKCSARFGRKVGFYVVICAPNMSRDIQPHNIYPHPKHTFHIQNMPRLRLIYLNSNIIFNSSHRSLIQISPLTVNTTIYPTQPGIYQAHLIKNNNCSSEKQIWVRSLASHHYRATCGTRAGPGECEESVGERSIFFIPAPAQIHRSRALAAADCSLIRRCSELAVL